VWYLTQWVSIFQFLISFLFIPFLCLPGFGSVHGTPLADLPEQFYGGFLCCMQVSEECADKPTFWLLIGYCGVNVLYNTLGLYVVKVASALMNALSYAILLPCTTLLFFTPLAGVAQEQFSVYSWFTLVGLNVALAGFVRYQQAHSKFGAELEELPSKLQRAITPDNGSVHRSHSQQESFQERIIFSGAAHGFAIDVAEARKLYGTNWQLVQPLLKDGAGRDGHGHHFQHQHGDEPPHGHEIHHDHKFVSGTEHAHGRDAEFGHGHVDGGGCGTHGHEHGHGHGHDGHVHGDAHECG